MAKRSYRDLDDFFRDHPDMSMRELGEEVGVSPTLMCLYRDRLRSPRLSMAVKLIRRCRIPMESLLTKEEHAALTQAGVIS